MRKVHSVNGIYFSSYSKALAEISRITGKPVPTKTLSIGSGGAFSQFIGVQKYSINGKDVTKSEYETELNGSCYPVKIEIAQNDVFVTTFQDGHEIWTYKLH
jgi:hypothetical protein